MKLSVSVEMFSMHTFFSPFFFLLDLHNCKKHTIYCLGGLWREKKVERGEGKWEDQVPEETLTQLLDDTQMHSAHTEHIEHIHYNTKKNIYFSNT